jgi:glycine/D-amino acid oxidase-like deaminating enzyme
MATRPYWLDRPLAPLARRRLARAPEAVVVGAGVSGCTCALTLAAAGWRVRLFEAGVVAGGASGRNGGFALRGAAPSYLEARERLGAGAARALWRLSERGLARLERLAGSHFRRVGSLRLAADAHELEQLRAEHAALRGDGFAVEWRETLERPLASRYLGGLYQPLDGALDPVLWVRSLAQRALAAGVEIVEGRRLEAGELAGLDCRAVVVAVDAHTSALLPELAEAVSPRRGQMIATAPLGRDLFARPHYARGGFDYWQQLPDRRLLLGGCRDRAGAREETLDDETTPLVQDALDRLAATLLETPYEVTHRWSGCWGETPDRLPLAGPLPGRERTWVACGYSGHGNVLGLVYGELVARAVLGEAAAELELVAPTRAGVARAGSAPG